MFNSYLDQSYLGQSDLIIDDGMPGPSQMVPAPAPQAPMPMGDMVQLPGGIVLPRKTLIVLAIGIAVAAFLYWKKKQQEG